MRFFANTPIIVKALFIVAVPLAMLSLFMMDEIGQASKDEASMQTMLQAADLFGVAATLVGELQKERGMSAGLLGSSGRKFLADLKLQQTVVDKAFSSLKGSIEKNTPLLDASPSLHQISQHFMLDMTRLKHMRQRVGQLDITVADELAYYISLVDDLMQISNTIRIMYAFGAGANGQEESRLIVPNARFSALLSSFILLGRASEAAGIERAVLSNTFGQGYFGANMYERFVSLIFRQQHLLHDFLRQSPESIGQMFSSTYAGEAVTAVERFRTMARNKATEGNFGVDPEQWFKVSSQRIELMQRVDNEIVDLIRLYSQQGVELASHHASMILIRWVLAILIAGGLSMWATWLLLLGIRRASQSVQAIEAGAYDVPVIVNSGDEMGQMLASVERMRLSLMAAEQAREQQEKKAQTRLEALLRTKDELHSKGDFIERLIAAIPSILIAVDHKGEISLWNHVAEKAFGLVSQAVTGTAFSTLSIEWDWQKINRSVAEAQTLCACSLDHLKYRRADGSDGFLGLTINAVMEDGQYNGFLLIGTDQTERIQLENQLQMAQKMESMGVLAAGIAHEINTPMQYIGDNVRFLKDGFADLLALISSYHLVMQDISLGKAELNQRVAETHQAEEDADIDFLRQEVPLAVAQTLEGIAHVSKIVGAMKELSHPGTGNKTTIDVNKAIENSVTVSRNEWKYIADLDMSLDPNLPVIHALPEIHQVFLNIIVNAAHAIEEVQPEGNEKKGNIRIVSACVNNWVEIRISDSGPGIGKQAQDKIFDPFFTTKAPGKGTGQGLAISHQIVCNRLGGRLFVESETGQGATFVIQLPLDGRE